MKLTVFWLALASAAASAQISPPANLSIEDLRVGADAYWGSIQTIRAAYRSAMPGPVTDNGVRDQRAAVALKGDKVHFDYTYGGSPAFEGRVFNRIYTFDGSESVEQDTTNGGAFIYPGRYGRVNPHEAAGFFDLCMLTTAGGSFGAEYPEASLAALLGHPGVQLRANQEAVAGHWCHVVDLNGQDGRPWISAWIDADRGYLPVRHVVWSPTGTPFLDFMIDDAIELSSGHWVPVRGRKAVGTLPGVAELSSPTLVVTQVEQDDQGRYAVAVNHPIDDSLFSLRDNIPPGFRVLERATGRSWLARGEDYKGTGSSIRTAVANLNLKVRRKDVPVQATTRDVTPPTLAAHAASGVGAAMFTSLLGCVALKRRRVGQ